MGKVTSCSTSAADRPGHSVCTTTWGGANSGNTSSRALAVANMPTPINIAANTTTTMRLWIDQWTMDCNISVVVCLGTELLGQENLCLLNDDRLVRMNAGSQDPVIA